MAKTMKSIYESFDQGQKCKDLIYFVEDDYIHKTESLAEMVFAYEKFSSIFDRELDSLANSNRAKEYLLAEVSENPLFLLNLLPLKCK